MCKREKVVPLDRVKTVGQRVMEFTLALKRNSSRASALGVAALTLAGCASAVVVESEFPVPLVDAVPVSMGLYYEPQLRDFIHAEALPRSSTWTIDLGDANLAMLEPLFGTLFQSTREVDVLPPPPNEAAGLDGVLSSALQQFQFDVPRSNRDEFVEVWLQYRLELVEPNGDVVFEWEVPGYGKAEIEGNREDAVHRASIVAMREAGAVISTKFTQQPAVSAWLAAKGM